MGEKSPVTGDCHAGILWEPGGEIPPGHPTSRVLREGASVSEKYEFIDAEYAQAPANGPAPTITSMCKWLGVSKSGLYEWRARPESATAGRRRRLALMVKDIFDDSEGTYGYRRIAAELARRGVVAGQELVRKLVRELGLVACQPRPRKSTTQQGAAGPIPDRSTGTSPLPGPAIKWSVILHTFGRGKAGNTSRP